jgi:alkanesulfonate monooxygenase SsuD/methylene tetrahydromethanopterin reductase-like flavin-dependent oxidoreductase (luciferase family)
MKLGVLDFGAIQQNSNAISTIHETIEVAQKAEEIGFHRYWLAEHYEESVAWTNPVTVLGLLA